MLQPALAFLLVAFQLCIAPASARDALREGDSFVLTVSGAPSEYTQDITGVYTVRAGAVAVPMIGRMPASGMKLRAFAESVRFRLKSDRIFRDPQVAANSGRILRTVIVGGEVGNPGRHALTPKMTLSRAISSAAGTDGWQDNVRLTRGGRVRTFSLKALKKDPSKDLLLQPNDQIFVGQE